MADARRFIRASTNRYDVIVGDVFHPARPGAGALYTVEHFQAIRSRLASGGLFCQWLPLHQLTEGAARSITASFLAVFPEASAYLLHFNVDIPVLGLVGRLEPAAPRLGWVEASDAVENSSELRAMLRSTALLNSVSLFGCAVADAAALRDYANGAPLNTDDRPRVMFEAPEAVYDASRPSYVTLKTFLEATRGKGAATSASGETNGFARQVEEFAAARDLYLEGLIREGQGDLSGALDLYLKSAGRSVFFTASYARCVSVIQVYLQSDPRAARELYERLNQAQPAQPLARKLFEKVFENPEPAGPR